MRTTALVLAAGQGKRMGSSVHKQYLLLRGKPVLYYSLKAFEDSRIDDIVLVVGKDEQTFCRKEILEKYGFHKVKAIVEGGRERYHSVANGIQAVCWACDYIFIHDGARPFVNEEMIDRALGEVQRSRACVVGMPVKDTIKIQMKWAMYQIRQRAHVFGRYRHRRFLTGDSSRKHMKSCWRRKQNC